VKRSGLISSERTEMQAHNLHAGLIEITQRAGYHFTRNRQTDLLRQLAASAAKMQTGHFEGIIRPKGLALKRAVEQLAHRQRCGT
jgi:hypothetical protein